MNATRLAISGIVLSALIAGLAMYYLQVYAFYDEVTAEDAGGVELTLVGTDARDPINFDNFQAIDSDSSPLRFRACFTTGHSLAMLTETYEIYDAAEPLVAPAWFSCFDARAIGEALESGEAVAFLSRENDPYGFDRVVAVFPDGRGYVWPQMNHCGEVVFDGDPAPEGCPPVPEGLQ
ncbi:DUF6446 family protein [Marivivens marinus]|uniref:DUF6446 family protein n=1 Tax=Marivivens marinus TaxID=3110173 RepID=UPI003B849E8C